MQFWSVSQLNKRIYFRIFGRSVFVIVLCSFVYSNSVYYAAVF